MKQYHQVTGLHFEGNVMILTIDGQEKRFQVSEISRALQHASEQEQNYLKSLRQAMAFIGHYSTRICPLMAYWALFMSRKRPQKRLTTHCSGRGDSVLLGSVDQT